MVTIDDPDMRNAAAALVEVASGDIEAWARVPVPLRAALAAPSRWRPAGGP